MYAFQSESKHYSCLNVKELLSPNRCEIWSDCNWSRAQNHLIQILRLFRARSPLTFTTTVRGFTLKCVRDMIRAYSQMHRIDKYSQHNAIIWPVWLNVWVFVYKLSGCGFELFLPVLVAVVVEISTFERINIFLPRKSEGQINLTLRPFLQTNLSFFWYPLATM